MDSIKEQFSGIYDQYIEKIYRFIYFKVNSQEIAEDLTSKVFTKGWEAYQKQANRPAGEQASIKNPGAFLYQIARNIVVDHYREKDKVKTVPMDSVAQLADQGVGVYEKAVLSADIQLVKSAISRLKEDHQEVLIWYYLEDMPAEQIAVLLDKPVGTVRVMIHRGLSALRDELIQEV